MDRFGHPLKQSQRFKPVKKMSLQKSKYRIEADVELFCLTDVVNPEAASVLKGRREPLLDLISIKVLHPYSRRHQIAHVLV
jgi:hypothetical protein